MSAPRYWDEALETAPWAEVQAWQAQQITAFVGGLRSRSAFYQQHLGDADVPAPPAGTDSLEFLAEYPVTTKDDLRRSQDQTRTTEAPLGSHQAAPRAEIIQIVSSSGTTGHPVSYGLTIPDLAVWKDAIACVFYTAGIRPADVLAHLVALPGVAGGLPYADGCRHLGATLAWLGGFPTERILASIPRLGVTAVLATSSFGIYLTDHCVEITGASARELGVRTLLGGGEPGLSNPEIRQKIRNGWGLTAVRDMMGLGDVLSALWAECDDESGMHFCGQRHVAVELVDPAGGKPVPWEDGATGEAVYTTFDRQATPVLRFRSADHVLVTGTSCPCGRTSPKIRCIGRTDDMLIYKAMNVFPDAIRDVALAAAAGRLAPFLRIWKEHAGQVRFDHPIPVEIEAAAGIDPATYAALAEDVEQAIRGRLQVRTQVTVVAPGTLPRTVYKTPLVAVRDS